MNDTRLHVNMLGIQIVIKYIILAKRSFIMLAFHQYFSGTEITVVTDNLYLNGMVHVYIDLFIMKFPVKAIW